MRELKTLTINGVTYKATNTVPTDSVTLLASAWKGEGEVYSQVVEIPGVTANTKVDLQPTSEQLAEFLHKVLGFVAENDGGVVTVFSIGERPMGDHTIQITKTEVEGTGKIRGNTVGTPTSPAKMEKELKPVKSVNGVEPDENGNVLIKTNRPIIFTDRSNAQNYLVHVEDGQPLLFALKSGSGKGATVILKDRTTGAMYSLYANSGDLHMEAVTEGTPVDDIKITDRLTWLDHSLFIDNGEMKICEV